MTLKLKKNVAKAIAGPVNGLSVLIPQIQNCQQQIRRQCKNKESPPPSNTPRGLSFTLIALSQGGWEVWCGAAVDCPLICLIIF